MGRKRKEKKVPARSRRGKGLWVAGVIVLLVVGWFAWGGIGTKDSSSLSREDPAAAGSYVRREIRTPLSPALFVGKTAAAYQVAQEIPDVLDRLYCYCECDRHMGHITLLSCFVDSHAAT
jgi:hypothetical protein